MQDARTCNALRIPNSNRAEWGYGPNHAAPKPTAKLGLIKVCIISGIKPRTHNAQINIWVDDAMDLVSICDTLIFSRI
jgi:hypothetical protein